VLQFGSQGQYKQAVWNDVRSNVPYLTAKSGTVAYRAYMASTKPAFLQHCGAMEHAICYAANHHHQVPSTFEGKMDVIPWCQTEYKDENLSDFNSEVPQATNNVTEPDEHTSATTRSENSFAGTIVLDTCHTRNFSSWPWWISYRRNFPNARILNAQLVCMERWQRNHGERRATRDQLERQLYRAALQVRNSLCGPSLKV